MSTNHLSTFRGFSSIVAVIALVGGVGCAHAKVAPDATANSDMNSSNSNKQQQLETSAKPMAADASAEDQQAQKDLESALTDLTNTRIFFGLDEDALTPQGRSKLAAIGDILAKHANLRIRIEGNCDERGTEGYNLVLGQRRADAARKYILSMGPRDGQVGTVSYGKERPVSEGHTEQAWKQNRRDDVVVVSHD